MVHPQEDKNDALMQHRDQQPRHEQPERVRGRLPYEGEIVGNKEPPFEVRGMDALSPLLMHVDFPATKEQIVQAIGGARIAVDKTRTLSVREVLEKTAPNEFRSSTEVEHAVQRIWQQVLPHPDRGSRHWQGDNLNGRAPN